MSTRIPGEDLLEDLGYVAGELGGEAPTKREYDELGDFSSRTLDNRFGSWPDALRAAELDAEGHEPGGPSDDELLADLRRAARAVGGAPTAADYRRHGRFGERTVRSRLGSWLGALREAGLDVSGRTSSSPNELEGGLSGGPREALEGELLGDGCIRPTPGGRSARFRLGVADEAHRDWVAGALIGYGFEVREGHRTRDGWDGGRKFDLYTLRTLSYGCLAEVYDRWYRGPTLEYTPGSNPSKRVPPGIELSPRSLLHWYLGDGCMKSDGVVIVAANGFTDRCRGRLVAALSDVGVEATQLGSGEIYVRAGSRDRFLSFMADPPDGLKPHRFSAGVPAP